MKFTKFLRKPFFAEQFRLISQKLTVCQQMHTRCHKEHRLFGHNLCNTVVVSFNIYIKWNCHIGCLLHICSMFYIKLRKSEKHSPDFKGQSCKLYNSKYTIASTQITNSEIFAFVAVLIFKLLSCKVLFINRQDNKK